MPVPIRRVCAGFLLILALMMSKVPAAETQMGSEKRQPSQEHPVGWRGDGSGHYPDADPPLRWEITSNSVKSLSGQSGKPNDKPGQPLEGGVLKDWLVLFLAGEPAQNSMLAELTTLSPDTNEKTDGASWQQIASETSQLNLDAQANEHAQWAYAHTYVHADSDAPLMLDVMVPPVSEIWINGTRQLQTKPGQGRAVRLKLQNLKKGWNRVLIKSAKPKAGGAGSSNWTLRAQFAGDLNGEMTRSENMVWVCPIPQGMSSRGISSPVIVGERLFVAMEMNSIVCLDKHTGKVQWVRTSTFAELATAEERAAHPEAFTEIDALVAELKKANADGGGSEATERKLAAAMKKVDAKKYALPSIGWGECGYAPGTLSTDGRQIYMAFASGLVVCYDLDGARVWSRQYPSWPLDKAHGTASSSLLIDGKLVVFSDYSNGVAFNAATGEIAWVATPNIQGWNRYSEGTGTPVRFERNGKPYIVTPIGVMDPADGKLLCANGANANKLAIPSPIVHDHGIVFAWGVGALDFAAVEDADGGLALKLRPVDVKNHGYPTWLFNYFCSSPLYLDGLVYWICEDGVLIVVDEKDATVVYRKELDLDLWMNVNGKASKGGSSSSITRAGKYLYAFGNHGTGVVFEPGRTFKQVSQNRLECTYRTAYSTYQEAMQSCPIFEGDRMYLSCETNLYCIRKAP